MLRRCRPINDNDIIKALECCTNNKCYTGGCPLIGATGCVGTLTGSALDLITRQKAEIERVRAKCEKRTQEKLELGRIYTQKLKTAKAEAVKEFAERLKEVILPQLGISTMEKGEAYHFCLDEINIIVKEMVGDV